MRDRPLWPCPGCGRRFANRNQWHSCGRFSVQDHLRGKPPEVVALYRRFLQLLRRTGPFRLHPVKTRIGVVSRITFAEIVVRRDGLGGHLLLPRSIESPRFTKIVPGPVHVHSFRIRSEDELDDECQAWLREAAAVGRREHLRPYSSLLPSPRRRRPSSRS